MFGVFSDLRRFSFGATAALVTGMGLIVGLNAATVGKSAVISSLLIIGLADNLTNSLSVHMYQESERLDEWHALRTTVANFFVRLLISISFVRAATRSAAFGRDRGVLDVGVRSSLDADLRSVALASSEPFGRNLQTLQYRHSGHRDKQNDRCFDTVHRCLPLTGQRDCPLEVRSVAETRSLRRAFHNLCNSIDDVLSGKCRENDAENAADDVGAGKAEQLGDAACR